MTLGGRPLWVALAGSLVLGVAIGVFAEGWRKARGLPGVVSVDAGVSVVVDAGTSSQSDCSATVEHWTTVYVPGPVRYLPTPDGGRIQAQPETIAILVPELSLRGSSASMAVVQESARAEAGASAVIAPAAPERHWEAGPVALYGFDGQQVLWGGVVGWSSGPFGIRLQALKGPGDVYAGGALVWRW